MRFLKLNDGLGIDFAEQYVHFGEICVQFRTQVT